MIEDDRDATEHGKALAARGAARGGKARALALSKEERQEIGRSGALARWGSVSGLPKATHSGDITIGDRTISAAVLETRKRVLTQETFLTAVGRAAKAKAGTGSATLVDGMPPFLVAENLKPFISDDLLQSTTPIVFRTLKGAKAFGYEALLLPKVCDVYLRARDAKKLLPGQKHIAQACDILMRGLAHVGIIALVDEATGYQAERARDELNKILEAYISRELLPWTKRFPDEFFKQVYRLHGWEYREGGHRRPRYVGKLVNKLVYEPLPPGVLGELRQINPPDDRGYRKYKHHQFLTEQVGHPHLQKQIVEVTTLMRVSDDRRAFQDLFNKAFPQKGQQMRLEFGEDERR